MPDDTRSGVSTPPRVTRKWRVVAVASVAAIVAILGLCFFAAPPLVKPLIEDRLSSALARKVTIGRLRINPLALSATLDDVSIGERGGGNADLFKLDELYVNAEASSLLHWAPVIRELRLTRPAVRLTRGTDNRYNVSDLLDRPPSDASPPSPPPRFSVSNIQIVDGRVDFDDQPEHQKHEITGITIGVPFLSSLPVDTEIKVAPTLAALVNGRPISVRGETRPFKDTHETVLHWETTGLPLPRYVEYAPGELPVRVTDGTLDAKIDLSYVGRGKEPPQLTVAGTARIAGLAVQERSGAPLLRVGGVDVTLDRYDAITGRIDVRSVAVDGAELNVRRSANGALNLATQSTGHASAPGKPVPFHVASITLRNGKVHVIDDAVSPRFETSLNDVTADIADLTSDAGRASTVSIAFTSDAGERFGHKGTLALQPLVFDGRADISGLRLARLFPYYGAALNLTVDDGVLDVTSDVHYAAASSAFTLANLAATVRGVSLRLADDKQPLWRMQQVQLRGGALDLSKQSVSVDSIEAHGANLNVRRNAKGGLNFARLVKTPAAGANQQGPGDEWHVTVKKLLADGLAGTFVDEAVKPPFNVALTNVVALGEALSTAPSARSRVELRGTVNRRGSLTIAGPLTTRPYGGKLEITAKNIDLAPFQPYVAPLADVVITSGSLALRGAVDFSTASAVKAGFKGNATLSDVVSLEASTQTDLLKWKTLSLGRVEATLDPLSVSLDDIAADAPYARLILSEDGQLNLQRLARSTSNPAPAASPPSTAAATTATAPQSGTTWLRIGKATMSDGNLDYTDHFIRPNYSANITALTGSLSALTADQAADVELHGKVQDTAPVDITGKINPLAQKLFLDLRAKASGVELPPLTPYSAKYVGYGIEKGKLSMQVHYLVDDRKLTAENSVILDQLTFGPKVESPDATKLPVLLAVSLLKDRNGVIHFDLPVGGSLDDPQFSVGGLVFRALGGLIAKMATAPFAVLGKLGGHSEDLSYVAFAPGSATIDGAGEARIDALGKALVDRPALKLDITGHADPTGDVEALKRAALDRRIHALKPDAAKLSPEEYDALLAKVYRADAAAKKSAPESDKAPTRSEMEAALLAQMPVDEGEVHQLAERRAQAVQARLAGTAHVPPDRMFLVAPKADAAQGVKDAPKGARVDFALR
jgi:outer membrane protein OmpA-like peptidoglycan-associated protein